MQKEARNILASFFCTSANLVAKDTQLFSFKQQFWQYQRKGQHHCLNDGINHKYQNDYPELYASHKRYIYGCFEDEGGENNG
jgi:hypothetical protein